MSYLLMHLIHIFQHISGVDDISGAWYGFWSGLGSDISELALFTAVFGMYRRHNCHVHHCPRLGKFPIDGTPFIVCRKHHPRIDNQPLTAEEAGKL